MLHYSACIWRILLAFSHSLKKNCKSFKRNKKDANYITTITILYCPGQNKFLRRNAEVWWKPFIICEINSVMSVARAFNKSEWIHQVFLCNRLAKLRPILSSWLRTSVWMGICQLAIAWRYFVLMELTTR